MSKPAEQVMLLVPRRIAVVIVVALALGIGGIATTQWLWWDSRATFHDYVKTQVRTSICLAIADEPAHRFHAIDRIRHENHCNKLNSRLKRRG